MCALLLMERGGMEASDLRMQKARQELKGTMEQVKLNSAMEKMHKGIQETEEVIMRRDLDELMQKILSLIHI